jgi:hypothetical protein
MLLALIHLASGLVEAGARVRPSALFRSAERRLDRERRSIVL